MATDVTLTAAALAGVLSFLRPCVLPLVPPYLTYIAGTTIEELSEEGVKGARREVRRMLAERSRKLLGRYRRGESLPEGECPLLKGLSAAS